MAVCDYCEGHLIQGVDPWFKVAPDGGFHNLVVCADCLSEAKDDLGWEGQLCQDPHSVPRMLLSAYDGAKPEVCNGD